MQSSATTSSKCSRYGFLRAAICCLWWSYRWWYEPILPLELSFPSACRRTLTGFVVSVSSHLSRKRPADLFLEFLTNASSIVIVFLSELSGALMDGGSPTVSPVEAVELYLQENPESNLANMLNIGQQRKKLSTVASDVLHDFLDVKAYDCEPARVFLREIMAKVVLEMTIQSCSTPDWINDLILYLLEGEEPELMNAIDAGVGGAAANEKRRAIKETSSDVNVKDTLMPNGYTKVDGQNETFESQRTKGLNKEATLESEDFNNSMPVEASERGQKRRSSDWSEPRTNNDPLGTSASLQRSQSIRDVDTWTLEGSEESLTSASSISGARSTSTFTSFDQILPSHIETPVTSTPAPGNEPAPAYPSLQDANICIRDDTEPGENTLIRAKPTADFILQIEQASSQQPGWMITRNYTDFENLHEVLRRISVVSGLVDFTEKHSALPGWKGKTKTSLREELERYLCNALRYDRLAESEGMKRFLSKDQGLGNSKSSVSGNVGFGFPSPATFETMGRGMIDVLSNAPKGAAVGGKSLLGGVTGVLSGVGSKGQRKAPSSKIASSDSPRGANQAESTSSSELHHKNLPDSTTASVIDSRKSFENDHANMSPRLSRVKDNALQTGASQSNRPLDLVRRNTDEKTLADNHQDPFASHTSRSSLSGKYEVELHLPPPPSDIPDDYGSSTDPSRVSISSNEVRPFTSIMPASSKAASCAATSSSLESAEAAPKAVTSPGLLGADAAITETEIQITVELVFAVINELYTLSSAWNIRRTLLNAARTYLLRSGNPSLEAIRSSVQDSLIDPYTSDSGLAALVEKVQENALPTDEERKAWPQPLSDDAKESRRIRARKVLVERGMPQALTAIMGAAASSEALGRVFDCLQAEEVARGLVFHLLLQAIKALTQ